MTKRIVFILIAGILMVSACTPASPEPVEAPIPTGTSEPDISEGFIPTEVEVIDDVDRMPCKTVFDYEISAETAQYQAIIDQQPPVTDQDWIFGNPDAPITIVEYADFQCPACVGFSLGVKQLIEDYPSSVRVVYRHLPLPSIHDKAYITAMVAEAAGAQGKFWEMHDLLFLFQREWSPLSEDEFVNWISIQVLSLGLDLDQFIEDVTDEEARAELERVTAERLSLGMNYTPFVAVNDRIWRENKPNLYGLLGIYEYGGFETCPPWIIDPAASYTARLDTSAGDIMINLFADAAPIAVNSFVFLAENGWYDGVYFHRVLQGFVAQAGDPSGLGMVGPGYTFPNETDNDLFFDQAGRLGMANAGVDTNGSQFFITLSNTESLDGGYTIFGQVAEESMAAVYNISLRDPATAIDYEDATEIYGIDIIKN